jgi:hypothetical protein
MRIGKLGFATPSRVAGPSTRAIIVSRNASLRDSFGHRLPLEKVGHQLPPIANAPTGS